MNTEPGGNSQGCINCAHYYITHDASFRYGCRALDFKSKLLPMLVVLEASGQQCHYFHEKGRRQKNIV